jgi:hypothetical protein
MSELDDLLNDARGRQSRDSAKSAVRREHGIGFVSTEVDPEIASLVQDFIARIPPLAGSDAYWIDLLGERTVHIPPMPIPRFSGWTRAVKQEVRARERAVQRDARGKARLLLLLVTQNDAEDKSFPLICIDGRWTPARMNDSYSTWDSGFEFDRADARRAMVEFLR